MLRFAITGHTSGIGKYIHENTICQGFTKSSGYDISISEDRQKIIKNIQDTVNIFINNAFSNKNFFAQTEMLYDIAEHWTDDNDKIIVNISSINADLRNPRDFIRSKYGTVKRSQDNAIEHLRQLCKCRIINIKPGVVNTPYNKEKDVPKLEPPEILDEIFHAVYNNIQDVVITKN